MTWRAQVKVKGRSESQTFSTKDKATSWARALESAIEDNRHLSNRRAQRTEFADLLQRYRDTALNDWREPSKSKREQHLQWWCERFAGLRLAEMPLI